MFENCGYYIWFFNYYIPGCVQGRERWSHTLLGLPPRRYKHAVDWQMWLQYRHQCQTFCRRNIMSHQWQRTAKSRSPQTNFHPVRTLVQVIHTKNGTYCLVRVATTCVLLLTTSTGLCIPGLMPTPSAITKVWGMGLRLRAACVQSHNPRLTFCQ